MGLPCEGGLAWDMGRKFTTERIFSKRFNFDYGKAVRTEHCNTAKKVVDALKKEFTVDKRKLFPFNFLPFIACNLILTMQLTKKPVRSVDYNFNASMNVNQRTSSTKIT